MTSTPTLQAHLDLLTTEAGGRKKPVSSGYRPALWFGETTAHGEPELHSVLVELDAAASPGDSGVRARLRPLSIERWPSVREGAPFDLFEGRRRVGRGVIDAGIRPAEAGPAIHGALVAAFEEWVTEHVGVLETREARFGTAAPDFAASFVDERSVPQRLIVNVCARRTTRGDIRRLRKQMIAWDAALGMLLTWDEPTPTVLRAIHEEGIAEFGGPGLVPVVRVVTARQLTRPDFQIVPRSAALTGIERPVAA